MNPWPIMDSVFLVRIGFFRYYELIFIDFLASVNLIIYVMTS
jgi:hypothetical protein